MMAEYNRVHAGASEIIFGAFQKQTEHRLSGELREVELEAANVARGQYLGAGLVVGIILAAILLANANHENVAMMLIGGGFLAVVTAVIKGRDSSKNGSRSGK